jgi:hypothetical protein
MPDYLIRADFRSGFRKPKSYTARVHVDQFRFEPEHFSLGRYRHILEGVGAQIQLAVSRIHPFTVKVDVETSLRPRRVCLGEIKSAVPKVNQNRSVDKIDVVEPVDQLKAIELPFPVRFYTRPGRRVVNERLDFVDAAHWIIIPGRGTPVTTRLRRRRCDG